jgi:hypothetical protein
MSPPREDSIPQVVVRVGLAVLLGAPMNGVIAIEWLAPASSHGAVMDRTALSMSIAEDGGPALNGEDPIEEIFWHTRDVVVPQTEETSATHKPNPFEGEPVAVADGKLDDIRGGFEFADANLKVSFGIERAVFINGQLVTSSVLNFKDLQWTSGTGGVPGTLPNGAASSAISLIQNGAGNSVSARLGANLGGTIIQNTLNDQNIQNITTINASLNSAQLMRSIAVQSAVHEAIVNSLRR